MKKLLFAALAALLLVGCGTEKEKPVVPPHGEDVIPQPDAPTKQTLSDEDIKKFSDQAKKVSKTLAESIIQYEDYTNFTSMKNYEFNFKNYLFLVANQYPTPASHIYNNITQESVDGMSVGIQEENVQMIAYELLGDKAYADTVKDLCDPADLYYYFPTQAGVPSYFDVLSVDALVEGDSVKATVKIADQNMGQDPSDIRSKTVYMKYKVMDENNHKFLRLVEFGDVK